MTPDVGSKIDRRENECPRHPAHHARIGLARSRDTIVSLVPSDELAFQRFGFLPRVIPGSVRTSRKLARSARRARR